MSYVNESLIPCKEKNKNHFVNPPISAPEKTMKKELEEYLFSAYPLLYRDRAREQSAMSRGICCGDGWYDLVDRLSASLEQEIAQMRADGCPEELLPRAVQVKEKIGSLRIYVRPWTDTIDRMTGAALEESLAICERCGQQAIRQNKPRAGGTLCERCKTMDRQA